MKSKLVVTLVALVIGLSIAVFLLARRTASDPTLEAKAARLDAHCSRYRTHLESLLLDLDTDSRARVMERAVMELDGWQHNADVMCGAPFGEEWSHCVHSRDADCLKRELSRVLSVMERTSKSL